MYFNFLRRQIFYPATYACHSSMAGTVRVSSSTEDASSQSGRQQQQQQQQRQQQRTNRPFVFGYDFQTSSSETTPRGTKTNTHCPLKEMREFEVFVLF